jgi:hypothetical protein
MLLCMYKLMYIKNCRKHKINQLCWATYAQQHTKIEMTNGINELHMNQKFLRVLHLCPRITAKIICPSSQLCAPHHIIYNPHRIYTSFPAKHNTPNKVYQIHGTKRLQPPKITWTS